MLRSKKNISAVRSPPGRNISGGLLFIPPKKKFYHFANKVNQFGDMSALCYKKLKKINLKTALWTIVWKQVTCPKCLKLQPEEQIE